MNLHKSAVLATAVISLVSCIAVATDRDYWSFSRMDSYDGKSLLQGFGSAGSTNYPLWNPRSEPCPLSPEQAIALSETRRNEVLHDDGRWSLGEVSLKRSLTSLTNELWYYEVEHRHDASTPTQTMWTVVNIMVGLDGSVPLKEVDPSKTVYALPTAQNRVSGSSTSALDQALNQYKLELLRKGLPPLPIPLTEEEDARLVEEGVLPPK